jgi:hypothetical protein
MNTENSDKVLMSTANLLIKANLKIVELQKEKKKIIFILICVISIKILDLENTLVVEIQKGILLYSCHIVRKFLNIDTEHKTQKSQNVEARRR